jgi:hypothetical protein
MTFIGGARIRRLDKGSGTNILSRAIWRIFTRWGY